MQAGLEARAQTGDPARSPVRVQVHRGAEVEFGVGEHRDRVPVAFLEVSEQVRVELRGPGDAALEEREAQVGEPARHATHHERTAHRFLRRGEVPEVVVHVVRRRHPGSPPVADAVERRADAEHLTGCPHRVVVVLALVSERVDPRARRRLGPAGARDDAAHHHGLESEPLDRVVQLVDCLFGREHGDHGDRFEPVTELGESFRVIRVERACRGLANFVVRASKHGQAVARIEQREVDADLVEPCVHQLRQRRGHPVEGVLGRVPVEDPYRHESFVRGEAGAVKPLQTAHQLLARLLADEIEHGRHDLEQMTVAIDDRMVDRVLDGRDLVAASERRRGQSHGSNRPSNSSFPFSIRPYSSQSPLNS